MVKDKEALILVFDIGIDSSKKYGDTEQTFFEAAKECILKILQYKIISKSEDEASIILMGTEKTTNELNHTLTGYENISEAFELCIPQWKKLRTIQNKIQPTDKTSDWFDALIVAINFYKTNSEHKQFTSCKIVVFSTFNSPFVDESFESIVLSLGNMQISLCIVSDSIETIRSSTNPEEKCSQFSNNAEKTVSRQAAETLIKELMLQANCVLYDIKNASEHLAVFQPKTVRPMPFNCDLSIGSGLKIKTAAYKLIAECKPDSWKTVQSSSTTGVVKMRTEYFKSDKEYELDMENIISGYMYGTTIVPYDTNLNIDYQSGGKSFECIGFTTSSAVLEDYLYGNDTYVVTAQKDFPTSLKMFVALVEAMSAQNLVMIARRVYNVKSGPKVHVLYPTHVHSEHPALTMLELPFSENLIDLNIPSMSTKRFQTTNEQNDAIEKLIDSMDLMTAHKTEDGNFVEAFKVGETYNPATQHILRTIAFRALHPQERIPNPTDKSVVEVSSTVLEKSKESVDKLKSLFKLEKVKKPAKVEWQLKHLRPDAVPSSSQSSTDSDASRIVAIGTVTPAEDFALLLRNGERFSTLCTQIQNIISDLVFKQIAIQTEKVAKALLIYREEAKLLGPYIYNSWIEQFKQSLLNRKKHEFWEEVIVKEGLGLISASENDMSTVTEQEVEEFYKLNLNKTAATAETDNIDVDDLFAKM